MLILMIENKLKYNILINYATKTCNLFSLVVKRNRKIFLKDNGYESALNNLHPYLLKKDEKIRMCEATGTTFRDSDLNYYECNKHTKLILQMANSVFDWDGKIFPEELCFYRNKKSWLVCVCHEKLLFVYNETKEDIVFFEKEDISYVYGV